MAGKGKGRRLRAPAGETTRPTAARLRQSLFDILASRLPGCR
ncbi:MAG: RsmD family RNA methyltransferase, partial [Myxococcaceae bacterium]|nr:RsmD family RNA methyltransferase [Myxococcaceae bacterium]